MVEKTPQELLQERMTRLRTAVALGTPDILHRGHRERYTPPLVSVLGSVVEEVPQDLHQPNRIGFEKDRFRWKLDRELLAALFDVIPLGLHGTGNDLRKLYGFELQPHLALGHPGGVEQIVDEPRHGPNLPIDDIVSLSYHVRAGFGVMEDRGRGAEGSEGASQLMGQHVEEAILRAVGQTKLLDTAPQRLLQLLPLGDILHR